MWKLYFIISVYKKEQELLRMNKKYLIMAVTAAAAATLLAGCGSSTDKQAGAADEQKTLVVGMEDVDNAKPAPDGINRVCDHFGLDKKDVLYIGDNTIDAKAAQNAGVAFAAVTTGTTSEPDFLPLPHVAIMKDLSHILDIP